jgi:hypothetical protein
MKGLYKSVLGGKQLMFHEMIMYSIVAFSVYAAIYFLIIFVS